MLPEKPSIPHPPALPPDVGVLAPKPTPLMPLAELQCPRWPVPTCLRHIDLPTVQASGMGMNRASARASMLGSWVTGEVLQRGWSTGGGTGPECALGKVLCLDDSQVPAFPSSRPKARFSGNSLPITPLSHPALYPAFRLQTTPCLGDIQLHVCREQEPVCGQLLSHWLLCREWRSCPHRAFAQRCPGQKCLVTSSSCLIEDPPGLAF